MSAPLSILVRQLMKAAKRSPRKAKQLLQHTEASTLIKALAAQPILWTMLAPMLLHTQEAKAGDPVFAPGVFKPFGLDFLNGQEISNKTYQLSNIKFFDIDGDSDLDMVSFIRIDQFTNPYEIITTFGFKKNIGTKENPKFEDSLSISPFNLPQIRYSNQGTNDGFFIITGFGFQDFDNEKSLWPVREYPEMFQRVLNFDVKLHLEF